MKNTPLLLLIFSLLILLLAACTAPLTQAPTLEPTRAPATDLSPTPTPLPATDLPPTPTDAPPPIGYQDATYLIEGQPVTLVNGLSEIEAAPGSATKITTRYFGNEATGDLNGDGLNDVAFLLTQTTGGTGTFFYVVVALQTATGYQGTNAFLLGDRIAPQTTRIENGTLVVNYADRNPGESFDVAPSLGVSKYLQVKDNLLVEVETP